MKFITNKQTGFTLLEMIVAIGIFSIVMLIATGSLLTIIGANKNNQAQNIVMNNLDFAIEGMSRTIRIGTNYHCGGGDYTVSSDCSVAVSEFAFEPFGGSPADSSDQVVYRKTGDSIEISKDGGVSFSAVTAQEIVVENLSFFVRGSSEGPPSSMQPRVVIVISGYADRGDNSKVDFDLQTTVSQRLLDT